MGLRQRKSSQRKQHRNRRSLAHARRFNGGPNVHRRRSGVKLSIHLPRQLPGQRLNRCTQRCTCRVVPRRLLPNIHLDTALSEGMANGSRFSPLVEEDNFEGTATDASGSEAVGQPVVTTTRFKSSIAMRVPREKA